MILFDTTPERAPVKHPRICPNCDGRRELITEIWQAFRSLPHEEQIHLMDSKPGEPDRLWLWFAEREALEVLDISKKLYHLPAERVTCQQCGGTGLFPPDNQVELKHRDYVPNYK